MKSVSIHCDFFRQIRKHTDEEIGRFFRALAANIDGSDCPELPATLEMLKELVVEQNNRFSNQQKNKRRKPNDPNEPNEPNDPTVSDTVSVPDTVPDTVSVPVPLPNPESKGQGPKDICAEPSAKADAPRHPAVVLLPLNDKSDYPVSEEQTGEWAGLYPAVDVMQQLRSMRGWLLASPTRRKTRAGIQKFINAWLAREQDRGSNAGSGPGQDRDRKEDNHANRGGAFGRRDAGGPALPPADRDKDRDWIKGFVNALDDLDDFDDSPAVGAVGDSG